MHYARTKLLLGLVVLGGGLYQAATAPGTIGMWVGIVVAAAGAGLPLTDTLHQRINDQQRRHHDERIAQLEEENAKPLWLRRQEEELALYGPMLGVPADLIKRGVSKLLGLASGGGE